VAYELDATTHQPSASPTVFVPLGEPVTVSADRKRSMFVVGREAALNVVEDGRLDRPLALTAFQGGAPCVGRAQRKVFVGPMEESGETRSFERGLILEGCPPSPNRYAMMVVTGSHPDARLIDGRSIDVASSAAASATPAWISGLGVKRFHLFARSPERFVAVREHPASDGGVSLELHVGTKAKAIGTLEIPVDLDSPSLLEVDGQELLVAGELVVSIAGDRLVRTQAPRKR